MELDLSTGHIPGAVWQPSPNQDARPADAAIDTLVIHSISLPPNQFGGGHIVELFTNCLRPDADPYFAEVSHLRVSAHFLIDRKGMLSQFVPVHQRAWHAGESWFRGRDGVNDFSIGIELEGGETQPYLPCQYDTLVDLTCALRAAFPAITRDRITGHSDIAPGRKTDPGTHFDWDEYLGRLVD